MPQMKARSLQEGTAMVSEHTEAAGVGSDISPRTESGDNDKLGQAEAN
jgi:hypothetical protein